MKTIKYYAEQVAVGTHLEDISEECFMAAAKNHPMGALASSIIEIPDDLGEELVRTGREYIRDGDMSVVEPVIQRIGMYLSGLKLS